MDRTFTETRGKVYVFGILASTSLAPNQDRWMAVDFSAFHDLFSEADECLWLTAVPWQFSNWTPIIGDPHAQRLVLPSPSLVTTVPVEDLKTKFIASLAKAAAKADPNDTIVIVLCGHGEEGTGSLIIGEPGAYHEPHVFLVSIACYAGWWRSPSWMLLAASDRHQTSAAMSTSGSGQMRGSVFTYALLAERADGHGLTAPHPVRTVHPPDHDWRQGNPGVWDPPVPANMHDPNAYPHEPLRSTQDVNFVFDPAPDTPSQLPVRPFTAGFLDRLQVVASSVPAESGDNVVGAVGSSATNFAFNPLSPQETALLQVLIATSACFSNPCYTGTASPAERPRLRSSLAGNQQSRLSSGRGGMGWRTCS